jgi:hypothetical protein
VTNILEIEQVDLLFATQKVCLFDLLAAVGGKTFAHTLMDPEALVLPDLGSPLKETLDLETMYIMNKQGWVWGQNNIDALDDQVDAFVAIEKDDFAGMSTVEYEALQAASPEV